MIKFDLDGVMMFGDKARAVLGGCCAEAPALSQKGSFALNIVIPSNLSRGNQ